MSLRIKPWICRALWPAGASPQETRPVSQEEEGGRGEGSVYSDRALWLAGG